jgi:hypothetical protein
MFQEIVSIVLGITFAICLFHNEDEVEEEKPTKKKIIRVKRNGKWVDEEL